MKQNNYTNILILLIVITYTVLFIFSIDFCYFWDNIQQTSSEAHFFYTTNFSIFPTNKFNLEFGLTGYHPPLIGLITATLWELLGYNIWVSHAFIYLWALILIYNTQQLIRHFVPENMVGWLVLILLFEPTVLTQFVIASPDFILLTAFVISIRAIIEQKHFLLVFGAFFLFGINMRGVFAGIVLFVSNFIYLLYVSDFKLTSKTLIRNLLPYFPTFTFLALYYILYFKINGWFFTNSPYSEHYTLPSNMARIITHFAEFGLRSIENGRFLIWGLGMYVFYLSISKFKKWSNEVKFIAFIFAGLFSIYFIFIFISQMPFSPRYFMPFYFLLSIIVIKKIIENKKFKHVISFFLIILILEISGNFWIYPEKIAKSWDTTLGHIPYYSLRKECFNYIDSEKLDYNDISAGFCLYGNRKVIELKEPEKRIGNEVNRKYFIYSNISNVEDEIAADFKNKSKWREIKRFEKSNVYISIFERITF